MLQCPEGRKLKGRADFNFFGHHIVAHLAPEEVVGDSGRKIGGVLSTPLRHFGVVMTIDDFQKTAGRLGQLGAQWLNKGTDKLTFHWQKILLTAFLIRSLPFPKTQRRRTLTPDKGGNKSDGAQD
jgi:extradiol dioxygenase family protein